MANNHARQLRVMLNISMASILIIMLVTAPGSIEASSCKIGISAQLQDDQRDILLPLRWEEFTFAPTFSIAFVSDAVLDYGIGAAFRYHPKEGKAVPYIGFRVAVFVMSPKGGNSITDFAIGPSLGGEYFLDDHFSIAVEAQVNISLSDENSFRFGNPKGINVNTATSILATYYF